ncbi:MAG: hypothetical protein K2G36_02240 [Ruminococcus sp.]|nr:hypothetical protein [Ruminococcus sp.]
MKEFLSVLIILCISACIVSCSDVQEYDLYDENFIQNFTVGEFSGVEKFTETLSPERFANIGAGKVSEMLADFDNDGVVLPDVFIFSDDTLKNFNVSDELYTRIRNKLSDYREMQSGYNYFFIIRNYSCTGFVCTDGTDTVTENISGFYAGDEYDDIYDSVYREILLNY